METDLANIPYSHLEARPACLAVILPFHYSDVPGKTQKINILSHLLIIFNINARQPLEIILQKHKKH